MLFYDVIVLVIQGFVDLPSEVLPVAAVKLLAEDEAERLVAKIVGCDTKFV